jgi:predicted esterase
MKMIERVGAVGGPHQGRPVVTAGAPLDQARAALLLVHGRGATAAGMLRWAAPLAPPSLAVLAPQASGQTWYPNRFLEPVERNEPWLSSALATLDDLLSQLAAAGLPAERVALLGFSQGACLTLEYVARRARRFGGVIGLAGGLIGPTVRPDAYSGDLAATPVFLGCGDRDSHIPIERVRDTAAVLRQLGGQVTERSYPGLDHVINEDEVAATQALLADLAAGQG